MYIGEIKRSLLTRIKELKVDVINFRPEKISFSRNALEHEHTYSWKDAHAPNFEEDYWKRKFIESFHIDKHDNVSNDKKIPCFLVKYAAL